MLPYIIKRNSKVKKKKPQTKNGHNPTTLSKLFHFVLFSSLCISVCNFYKVVIILCMQFRILF